MSLFTDFEEMSNFNPAPFHKDTVEKLLDEVIEWSTALKTIRVKEEVTV